MRRGARVVLFLAGAFVVIVATVAVALILPGTPNDARSLRFQGFVPLPGRGLVQVLDYLTVYRRELFVTNVSTGDVYKIALRTKQLPSAADISIFENEPAAHGVVVDPASGIGFVTRSGANAV